MNNINGALYRVIIVILKQYETKCSRVKSVLDHCQVKKPVPSTCSGHGKHTVAERRASGRSNRQRLRVSGPDVTAVAVSRSQIEVTCEVWKT